MKLFRYDALSRKLHTQESEGTKSSERAENVEVGDLGDGHDYLDGDHPIARKSPTQSILVFTQVKFMDIEDELKVVGQNQQTLEVRILIGNFGRYGQYDHM